MSKPDFAQSESAVRASLDDVTNGSNLFRALHEFSKHLTTMHKELVDKEGQYMIVPGEADKITAEYCESFIWAVVKTIEKSREAERLSGEHQV